MSSYSNFNPWINIILLLHHGPRFAVYILFIKYSSYLFFDTNIFYICVVSWRIFKYVGLSVGMLLLLQNVVCLRKYIVINHRLISGVVCHHNQQQKKKKRRRNKKNTEIQAMKKQPKPKNEQKWGKKYSKCMPEPSSIDRAIFLLHAMLDSDVSSFFFVTTSMIVVISCICRCRCLCQYVS